MLPAHAGSIVVQFKRVGGIMLVACDKRNGNVARITEIIKTFLSKGICLFLRRPPFQITENAVDILLRRGEFRLADPDEVRGALYLPR